MAVMIMKPMWMLFIVYSFSFSSGETYHILPSENDQCFGERCLTLSEFAANSMSYLQLDTTLSLYSGSHKLDFDLSVSEISKFFILPRSPSSRVKVTCTNSARLAFHYANVVNISGVNFIGCIENQIRSVIQFILTDSSFSGQGDVSGTALQIIESSANVKQSEFYFNHGSKMLHSVKCGSSTDYRWRPILAQRVRVTTGGAIVSKISRISILQCMFKGNRANVGGAIFCQYRSDITIADSTFEGNHATSVDQYKNGTCLGGGGVMHVESDCSVDIQNSHFIQNTAHYFGGAIDILHAHNAAITINNSTFVNNSAKCSGVLNVFGTYTTEVIISDSEFKDNNAEREGGAISLLANIYFWSAYAIKMTITRSKFIGNEAGDHGGVMTISYTENSIVTITKSEFVNNGALKGGGVLTAEQNNKINISIIASVFNCNKAHKGGVLMFYHNHYYINLAIYKNQFQGNIAQIKGGTIYIEGQKLRMEINESSFSDSMAESGGAMFLYRGEIIVANSTFTNCSATSDGGGLYSVESDVCVFGTTFEANRASKNGGTVYSESGRILIDDTSFMNSSATCGGALYTQQTSTIINGTEFMGNRANNSGGTMYLDREKVSITSTVVCDSVAGTDGGAIHSRQSDLFIAESQLFDNRANNEGGVLRVDQGNVIVNQTSFMNNTANLGAVLWDDRTTIISNAVNITGNQANSCIVYHMVSTSNWSSVLFTSNIGSLCAMLSTVSLRDVVMTDMQPANQNRRSNQLEEGGAITAFQATMIRFYGLNILTSNNASTGGAINAVEAKMYILGNVTVVNNSAIQNGGGICLRQSILTCQRNSTLTLKNNIATGKGGGIHAVGSSIKINGTLAERNCASLQFVDNKAEKGGGLHLEMDAKLYILKSKPYTEKYKIVAFTANRADHGGAVYVSDGGMCTSARRECFFQSLALYNSLPIDSVHQSIHFLNNNAVISGNSLYGGLLDRCTINPLAEIDMIDRNNDSFPLNDSDSVTMKGSEYLHMMSNIEDSEIGSPGIRVCFCRDGQPDCSYQPNPIPIRKGNLKKVALSLVVLDQINRPLTKAKIYNRLSSGVDLCQYDHIHSADGNCSKIHFAAFTKNEADELILFTDGPCKDMADCQCKIKLETFCPHCPVGFELTEDEEGCRCNCDSKLKPFIFNCSLPSQSVMRKKNCWITSTSTENNSSNHQYLIYPHCPLDYCLPAEAGVALNLNIPNGSDAQCANGRSGLLCGTCQPGFSLSLGSSRCIRCSSTHWPAKLAAIIIAAFIAGIVLVILILVLNLTVAVGSLNGVIFYANIVAANSNTFFHFSNPNFATVFISWFNLEIGFDVCFFDGLNSYWKTLLQLVFPAYIFLLVVIIIIISEVSSKFTKLIGKRNPVATLATLVLISYAKFLHTIIAALSFAVLHYPDGSKRMVWLPNASIGYLQDKHIALFIAAILILLVGLVYTFLLFSWQWLRRREHRKLFKWMRYQKLHHFIEPYHAPYADNHRYWTGLLLLVRVFLYIISAINISGDPQVSLVAIITVVTALQLIRGTCAKTLYRSLAVDIIETIMFFNLVILSTATLYTFDTAQNQTAVAYTSVSITFVIFLAIIAFHIYKYTGLYLLCQKIKAFRVVSAKLNTYLKKRNKDSDSITSNNSFRDQPLRLNPTRSVVEIHDLPSPED